MSHSIKHIRMCPHRTFILFQIFSAGCYNCLRLAGLAIISQVRGRREFSKRSTLLRMSQARWKACKDVILICLLNKMTVNTETKGNFNFEFSSQCQSFWKISYCGNERAYKHVILSFRTSSCCLATFYCLLYTKTQLQLIHELIVWIQHIYLIPIMFFLVFLIKL